jgi:hypothetical protein
MMVCICCLWQMFAAADELLWSCSCDIIGVLLSMPKSRLGYLMVSSGGNDIEVIAGGYFGAGDGGRCCIWCHSSG